MTRDRRRFPIRIDQHDLDVQNTDRLPGRAGAGGNERDKNGQHADHEYQCSPAAARARGQRDDEVAEPLLKSDRSIASPMALYPASLGCR